jgi:hypothetical protein
MRHIFRRATLTGLAVSLAASVFIASTGLPAKADDQAPGVARLSAFNGDVSIKRGDSGEVVGAQVNAPVEAGDYLSTGDGGRVELQLDAGNALRADSDTQLRFTQIGPTVAQVAQGTVELRTFNSKYGTAEIDTPNATIRPDGEGAYRVTVNQDGSSDITARSGHAQVALGNTTQDLAPGSTLLVSGNAQNPQYQFAGEVAYDDFDSWNQDRDRLIASANDDQYVNGSIVGTYDLNDYGQWEDDSNYGEVWVPNEPAGWAPYQDGQWAWEGYYGWTWVGYEPWGWAPYHYGRWFYRPAIGWAWWPGPVYSPAVWQPGLVAFFGFGNVGVGIGFGGGYNCLGWVPLAPYEPYHRWWGGYGGRNVTIVNNTTIVNNINGYRNIHAPGGLDAVSYTGWRNGDFSHRVPVPSDLRNVHGFQGVVPVVPTNNNLRFSNHTVATRLPNPTSTRFGSFSRQPQIAGRASFAQEQHAVQQVTQRSYPQFSHNVATREEQPQHPNTATFQQHPNTATFQQHSNATTFPHNTVTPVQRNAGAGAEHPANEVWGRFNTARFGNSNGAVRAGGAQTAHFGGTNVNSNANAHFSGTRANDGTTPSRSFSDIRAGTPVRTAPTQPSHPASTNNAWSRFGGSRPDTSVAPHAQPQVMYGENDPQQHTYSAPNYAHNSAPSYSQPRSYNSAPSYSQPRSYSAPSYSQPRSYSAPRYSQPRSYNAPSYSQPRSYSAPSRSYSSPSQAHSAPSHSSGGGGGHGHGPGG